MIEAMAKCVSRNSTAFGIGEISEEVAPSSDSLNDKPNDISQPQKEGEKAGLNLKGADSGSSSPKDVIREYVLQEEEKIAKRKAKLPLKFRDLKPVSVAKNRARLNSNKKGANPSNEPLRTR